MSKKLLSKLAVAAKNLQRVEDALNKHRKNHKIQCSCGKAHRIGDLELIITHWYVAPRGYTGGDYWEEGEWEFECPKTGETERLLFFDKQVESQFEDIYKYLFKGHHPTYDRKHYVPQIKHNNTYIQDNPEKFDLLQ